jgi:hypothetical protein
MIKIHVSFLLILSSTQLFSQGLSKDCFDAMGKAADEVNSAYCVVGKKLLRIEDHGQGIKDTVETYTDTVSAYYTGVDHKPRFLKIYNADGYEDGNFVEFYPTGRLKERGSYKQGKKIGYVTRYYREGNPWSTLQFFSEDERISDLDETNYKIMTYHDTSGAQLVKGGNGFCRCQLVSGRIEVGKVVDGVRDSIWSEYSGDTLVLQEYYEMGKFREGVRFDGGAPYKYRRAAEPPQYVDGDDGMMKIFYKNIRYPTNLSGVVAGTTVSFLVKEDGSIGDLTVTNSSNKNFNREVLRVVSLLKKWNPARLRGKPVATRFSIPIKLKL